MPTVKQKLPLDSNVVLQPTPASAHQQLHVPHAISLIYYALAAFVVISLLHTGLGHCHPSFLPLWARGPRLTRRRNQKALENSKHFTALPLPTTSYLYHLAALEEQKSTPARPVQTEGLTASVLGMEEQYSHGTRSRGVSRSSVASKCRVSSSHSGTGREKSDREPSPSSRSLNETKNAPTRTHSHSSSDNSKRRARTKGKAPPDDQYAGGTFNQSQDQDPEYDQDTGNDGAALSEYPTIAKVAHEPLIGTTLFSRPPQPPPFTPPTLAPTIFTFRTGRPTYAVPIPTELELGFIHQPNPDYMDSLNSTDDPSVDVDIGSKVSTMTPTVISRRRSYTKTAPGGLPVPKSSQKPDGAFSDHQRKALSPSSSYPPSSPYHLPPPPPPPLDTYESYERIIYDYDGHDQAQAEIEIQGEIISALDEHGHGWKRHTRVYGGGVCLACAASASNHGEGGFYGPRVPLSERR